MLKSEMVSKNPLRVFDQHREGGLEPGQTGLIAARAGTGKTALLIQLALDNLFRNNPVVHVSIGETVSHVQAWYEELFRDLAAGYELEMARQVWEEAIANRLILTFRADAFTIETLEERLGDLIEQDIFKPRVVILDGLDLHGKCKDKITMITDYARKNGLKVWVSTRTHREDGDLVELVKDLMPLFDVVLGIEPTKEAVALTAFKASHEASQDARVELDPKTLLLVAR